MNTKIWRWIMICTVTVALVATVITSVKPIQNRATIHPVSAKEERATAESLLASKLSGPRYFNAAPDTQPEGGVLWIEVEDALKQVPDIDAERKLGPEAGKAVLQLIEKLSEAHPNRMVGGKRLNLSLDSIK